MVMPRGQRTEAWIGSYTKLLQEKEEQIRELTHKLMRKHANERRLKEVVEDFVLEKDHLPECEWTHDEECFCMDRRHYNYESCLERAKYVLQDLYGLEEPTDPVDSSSNSSDSTSDSDD